MLRSPRPFPAHSALVLALLLAGCGGGDGGTLAPTPPNRAPVFTSPGSVSVAEGSSSTVYTASASDADGDALTFNLSGGADVALFRITPAGVLTFVAPPDFEMPLDSDRDNVYRVQIGVSDGRTSTTLDLLVTVVNGGPDGFRVARVGTGFSQPLFVAPVPDGSGRVFVVERPGRIRILNPATGVTAATPFIDISAGISTDGERGLLGFATAPDFATSLRISDQSGR